MRAIVLAAGQGTRLRPLTDDRPKALVPLAGRTLLERARDSLAAAGVTDLWIVAGYRADMISRLGFRIVLNPRYETTNMVASLFCARDLMDGTTDLLVCYGDIVFEPRVIEAMARSDAPLSLGVNTEWLALWSARMPDPLADAETLKIDSQGYVIELGKKPRDLGEVEGQYMGLIKVRADQVAGFIREYGSMDRTARYDGKDFNNMFMTSFIQHLISRGMRVAAVRIAGGWLEVDSVDDLRTYERLAAEGTLDRFCMPSERFHHP